ncbi:MAG: hypothetical protein SynsKO_04650 [Synoicihabitans sp.]
MDRIYWEQISQHYAQEIFSVIAHDRRETIARKIKALGGNNKTAADIGCGPGLATSLLVDHFDTVHACDWSPALLDQARTRISDAPTVVFHDFNLAGSDASPFAPVDFGLCLNVIISPDAEERQRLWRNITGLIAAQGTLLLVLPSHESALFVGFRRMDWNLRAGLSGTEAEDQSLESSAASAAREQGVRPIEGTPTKHFLKEEIEVQLRDHGFEQIHFTKLPYEWTTEFDNPPAWMGEPRPWHWLVEARR